MKKTITFTIMHFSIAFIVAGLLSGDWRIGGAIALVEPLVNSVGYFFHERFWAKHGKTLKKSEQEKGDITHVLHI